MNKRLLRLEFGITRRYGDHEIYFSMTENVNISSGRERVDAYNSLISQVNHQIAHYEKNHLPHVKLPQSSGNAVVASALLDSFNADKLVVESKSGKRYVSVKGGRWAKFGVPIYPECETDLPLDDYDYGEHDLSELGLTATVDIVDGTPKRTLSIK